MVPLIRRNRQNRRNAAVLGALALGVCAFGLRAQKQVSETEALAVLQRCAQCTGPSLQMSYLALSTREGMLKGGDKGRAVIPGDAAASPLYRRVAGLQKPIMPMPPVAPLKADEIALLKDWIDQGAKWPAASYSGYTPHQITSEDRSWWSFQKPVRHAATTVSERRCSR